MNPSPWKLAIAAAVTVALIAIVFTRFGTFFFFELIGGDEEVPLDFADGPLHASYEATASGVYDLPQNVEKPTGIYHAGDELFLLTDQAELFVLNKSMEEERSTALIGGPLLAKQGLLTAITLTDDGVLAIGRMGAIGVWRASDFERRADKPIQFYYTFTGIAQFDEALFATAETGDGPAILINLTEGNHSEIRFGPFVKAGRDASELKITGVAAGSDALYLVTKNYTSIIVVDPETFAATAVIDIDDLDASDISMRDGRAYVTVDHGHFDDKPPLYAYDLNR